MDAHILKSIMAIVVTSNILFAGGPCSGGACTVTAPHIPDDIQNSKKIKPFNLSGVKEIENDYSGWALIDNGGDNAVGENRFMAGTDIHSLFSNHDKLSLFGLITDESLISGKVSYAHPLPWNSLMLEASYIQSNYNLEVPFPGATGIGTIRSIEGKIIYPAIASDESNLDFSLSLKNNNINEEITNNSDITNSGKASYSATARMDFNTKNNKFYIGVTTGYLSFDNINDEKIDALTFNTKGSYTKINIKYKNTIPLSKNTTIESNFRTQYAFNNKNLDDSESFTIGGINGVKIYEEGSVYSSNGFFANIEAKYKLPDINGINNSIGAFYDYGQIWESEDIIASNEDISVQDTGIGIYTHYKKFFSKVQAAFKIKDSLTPVKDDKDYRVIFQTGFSFWYFSWIKDETGNSNLATHKLHIFKLEYANY